MIVENWSELEIVTEREPAVALGVLASSIDPPAVSVQLTASILDAPPLDVDARNNTLWLAAAVNDVDVNDMTTLESSMKRKFAHVPLLATTALDTIEIKFTVANGAVIAPTTLKLLTTAVIAQLLIVVVILMHAPFQCTLAKLKEVVEIVENPAVIMVGTIPSSK